MRTDDDGLNFFDCNASIGRRAVPLPTSFHSVSRLREEMAHHGIGEALVYHATCRSSGPQPGNGILLEELADHSELHPCWTLLPHWTGEIGEPEEAVGGMLARGVNAAKIYPTYHSFALAEWSVGPLLAALQQHRVPLLMDFDIIHWGHDAVPWDSIYQLCRSHPDLPIILLRLSIMDNRNFFPLLAQCDNLHVEVSYYQAHRGIEAVCERFGAERLIFGTGMPVYGPGAPLALVNYCGISDEEKRLIAGENLRSLLGRVEPPS